MTSKRIAQTNQQQKSEKPQASGILQRAAVRSIADVGVQSTDDKEVQPLSNSVFSKDFSRVPITTTKPQQRMKKMKESSEEQQEKGEAMQAQEKAEVFRVHKENKTGLPDNLKEGIENLSGIRMDEVRVHYNSQYPAQLQALAYTQGTEIYVASRQEEHLPHEAWHVVQQKQGRVKPRFQALGMPINDDAALEREAEERGGQALSKAKKGMTPLEKQGGSRWEGKIKKSEPIQLYTKTVGGVDTTTDSGTWVNVFGMKKNDPDLARGSGVSVWPYWWPSTAPQTADEFMRVNFVQGHLLNEKLGGRGDTRANLTPLTRSANAQMSVTIENKVKTFLNQGYIVDYEVSADYTDGSAKVSDVGGNILSRAEKSVLRNYLNHVPGWITAKYTLYDSQARLLPQQQQPLIDSVKNEGKALRGQY